MLCIYLARHGQDEDNVRGILNGRRDMPLSAKGLDQAAEVASKIKDTGIIFDAIYSSPLQRTYATAEVICNFLGAPKPQILPELIERDFGVMTGRLISDIESACAPDIIKTSTIMYFLNPDGAETFPQLLSRASAMLAEIKCRHSNGKILLVTHGDIGKMIYVAYYGLDWMNVLKMFHFGNSELLELSEASGPDETHVFRIEQHNL